MSAGRLAYLGHATVLIELGGVRLLTDPVLRGRVLHVRRRVPLPRRDELADLDAILVSHAHADHLDVASLRAVAHGRLVVAPRGCAPILRRAGVGSIAQLDVGEWTEVGGLRVEAVPAEHDGRRYPVGRQIPALGFLIDGPARVYFAGDTDLFDGLAALEGRVDVALLPIWGWGPRLPAGHMDPHTAARAVALIRPVLAVPIHWGTLRVFGAQRKTDPRAPAEAFAEAVAATGVGAEVRILEPGESLSLAAFGRARAS